MDERKEQGLLRLIAARQPGTLERIRRRTDLTPTLLEALSQYDPVDPMDERYLYLAVTNWNGGPDLLEQQQACFEQVVSELAEQRREGLPEGSFRPVLSTEIVNFPGLVLLAERGSSDDIQWLLNQPLVCPLQEFPRGWPFPWTLEPVGLELLRGRLKRVPFEYRQVALFDLLAQALEANPALDEIPADELWRLTHWWAALPGVTERQWAALTVRPTLREAVASVREVKINGELHHRLYLWATGRDDRPLMRSLLRGREALSDEAYLELAGRVSVEDRAAAILAGGMTPRVIDELLEDPELTRELLDPRGEGAVLSIPVVHGFSERFADRIQERFGLRLDRAII
ncbi:hypothetical protein [Deinococcus knuensis]|uniref:Uncharacterized protein n=1 Tax=Deinococcus knuensis TaxID=1837380 RepID=A0ABQ2SSC6_9DEIO|nr:hypothetical protein [Deinococcus knuensis]GGS36405.1 hypothetical protein GCM10008961_30010 [Deinococcus knuensis]